MAWIESHQSLRGHRKILHLARLLQTDRHKIIGHLHCLWWWGMDNAASDGCLPEVQRRDLGTAAEWDGDTEQFGAALITTGFVEEAADGTLYLHDWYDYAGKLLVRRQADRERKRRSRAASSGCPADVRRMSAASVRRTSAATVPNPTVPNQTESSLRSDSVRPTPPPKVAPPPLKSDGKGARTARATSTQAPLDDMQKKNPAGRSLDELALALLAAVGEGPEDSRTRSEWGLLWKIHREISQAGGRAADIAVHAANYRQWFPDMPLTLPALAKHWAKTSRAPPAASRQESRSERKWRLASEAYDRAVGTPRILDVTATPRKELPDGQ